MRSWRAGCAERRTSGSEGGPRKRTRGNASTAPRLDPYKEAAALEAARAALEAAQRSGDDAVIAGAADTLARVQITWWHYADAFKTAAFGMEAARRAGWLAQAAFLLTLGALQFYVSREEDALTTFDEALAMAADGSQERRWRTPMAGADRLKVRFFARYLKAAAYAATGRWSQAIEIASQLDGERLAQTSYMIRNNVLNLQIAALLERNDADDARTAAELAEHLREDPYEQGSILDFSTSVALSRARVAVRLRAPDAAQRLAGAMSAVEFHAVATPLECDRAFEQLARAAAEGGARDLEALARRRHEETSKRRGAAKERALLTMR